MSELKPCPFCGKEVFLVDVATRSSANAKWDVYCRTHGCFLNSGTNNMFSNREEAFIAWNTRAEPPELIALREQVRVLTQYLSEDGYDMLRLIATVKYLRGIAERGAGRLCDDNELVEQFVLGYVKGLEEQVKVLQETLDKAAEVADYLHRACLNPSRPRQAIGEMANYLLNTLIAALKQTKPKDNNDGKQS